MGAAGDMLTAALLELLPEGEPGQFLQELNSLGIPGVHVEREPSVKCGITGTHVTVTVHGEEEESEDYHGHKHDHDHIHPHDHSHDHDHTHPHDHDHSHPHHHTSMHDIEHIVRGHLQLPEKVKEDILAVYRLIAEAESHAHGMPVAEIHFHEVGTMDAIADITAVCMLMNRLAPDEVVVSPVHVGSGQVRCAHGVLPVPAPATAHILRDVPIYGGSIRGELCTPTGAALLKHFASRFGSMPVMRTEAVGYGMGKKDFEAANCVRAMVGESGDGTSVSQSAKTSGTPDIVVELSCNVDDMTAEAIGFAMDRLFDGGALEVYTVPVGMKKSRPGTLIRVLCREADKDSMVSLMFRYTTTIGIREALYRRYVLDRTMETIQTPYGVVRRKNSFGYGVTRSKYEYDDLAAVAKEKGVSLEDVVRMIGKND